MFEHIAMWTWPDAVRDEDPKRMVDRLKAAHVDIIIPYVSEKQNASVKDIPFEIYEEKLHEIIDEAHKQNMKVHGCFDEINAYESMPDSVYRLRQVFADGSMNGSLCPANPETIQYVLKKLKHVLTDFDYDGINLEDGYIFNSNTIYDPANQQGDEYKTIPVCYCDYCKKNAPIGKPEWAAWKQASLTNLVKEESKLVRQIKPDIPFSVAARMPYARSFYEPFKDEIPYYDGWQFCQSRDAFSADWVEWLRQGYIDFVCPMSYFHSPRMVELQTRECHALFPQVATNNIWMGLVLSRTIEFCQTLGQFPDGPEQGDSSVYNDAKAMTVLLDAQEKMGQRNCVLFSYEQLLDEHIPIIARYRKE